MSALCLRHGATYGISASSVNVRKGNRVIRLGSRHFPHAPEVARLFDTYFEQVVPGQYGDLLVVDFSRPSLHRYKNSGLEFELSSFPEESATLDDYFRWYRPQEGDLAFDLGAYCGVSTYYLSKAVGEAGRVIAFEPDPANFRLLMRNIDHHSLKNVEALNVAVAGSHGSVEFNSEGTLGSRITRLERRQTIGETIEVQTTTLEDACREYGLPAFVKMDVEGAELEILSSSRDFLRNHAVQFAIDSSHVIDGQLTNIRVERLLLECGYEALSSSDSGLMTTWGRKLS